MSTKRAVVIAGAVTALVGLGALARIRMSPGEGSFYMREIWLPHAAMSEAPGPLPPCEGPIPGERVSLDRARARTLFPISLPSYMPEEGRLREVYVSSMDDPPLHRQAALVYDNGVYIILWYGGMTWSWESPFHKRPEGFETLEVNGHAGVGAQPRPERICVSYAPSKDFECHDGSGLMPGVVEWQAEGLVTAVYSYDYSLAELLRVAESMDAG